MHSSGALRLIINQLTKNALFKVSPHRRSFYLKLHKAVWLWQCLRDFEREGLLAKDPRGLLAEMTEEMRADVGRLLPPITDWLKRATPEKTFVTYTANANVKRHSTGVVSHVWMAPGVQGFCCVRCRRLRSCVRPFGAV